MKETINQLKKLQAIKPSTSFSDHSRSLILAESPSPVNRFRASLLFSFSTVLTATFIIVVIAGVNYIQKSPLPLVIAGLDISTLRAEADNLNIDISISELDYYQNTPVAVESALIQTASDDPVYFEKIILDKETADINLDNPINTDLDRALLELTE